MLLSLTSMHLSFFPPLSLKVNKYNLFFKKKKKGKLSALSKVTAGMPWLQGPNTGCPKSKPVPPSPVVCAGPPRPRKQHERVQNAQRPAGQVQTRTTPPEKRRQGCWALELSWGGWLPGGLARQQPHLQIRVRAERRGSMEGAPHTYSA